MYVQVTHVSCACKLCSCLCQFKYHVTCRLGPEIDFTRAHGGEGALAELLRATGSRPNRVLLPFLHFFLDCGATTRSKRPNATESYLSQSDWLDYRAAIQKLKK